MMKKESVAELSESDFLKLIGEKKNDLIITDFFADWCMPCVMMAPVFEKLAKANPKVKFCKVNVDNAGRLSEEYQISSIPCIIFFKDGKEVDRIVGGVSEGILREKIEDYLNL